MKQAIPIIAAFTVLVTATIAIVYTVDNQPEDSTIVGDQQADQSRPAYKQPEWVVNAEGQRCIKQGTTVTCG